MMPPVISPAALRQLEPRRICLIKPSALGDVAQTLPLLTPLRTQFPNAEISWVINRQLAGLLEGHPDLREVIPFDRHGGVAQAWKLLRKLKQSQFDLTIDLQGLLRTGIMTWATGAATRIGLQTAREGSPLAYSGIISGTSDKVPAHARYWRVVEELGQGHLPRRAVVPIGAADRGWVRDRLWGLPRPLVAMHPGARWETKRWPAEKFADVAVQTGNEFSGTIIVIGGHGDWSLGSRIVEAVTARRGKALNLAGHTSLKVLAALLEQVDLVVSNDSGPLHLAAELKTPVVGIYTCTSPRISGPSGTEQALVSSQLPCAAAYHTRCPNHGVHHLACLQEITTDRVFNAVARMLTSRTARSA